MSSKRYPKSSEEPAAGRSLVNEAKPKDYGGRSERRNTAGMASNIAAVKKRLKNPPKRSKAEVAWALEIAGIGEGPADLSQRVREYRYGDK